MKIKNSRKLRKLMILTSLCTILSCSSGGGGGSGGGTTSSNAPTPGNSGNPGTSSVVITNTRFTATPNLAKLKEGIYDELDYNQAGLPRAINGQTTTINSK